jgi:lipoate-protein ligase A
MFTLLRVPWAKTCMEVVNVAKDKITSINDELGRAAPREKVNQALIEGFQKGLGVKFVDGELTIQEHKLAQGLFTEKYAANDWNLSGKDAGESQKSWKSD